MGLHGGYDNRNSRERNKNEIVLTKKSSLSEAPIDQNALRFSQMQYGLLFGLPKGNTFKRKRFLYRVCMFKPFLSSFYQIL